MMGLEVELTREREREREKARWEDTPLHESFFVVFFFTQ